MSYHEHAMIWALGLDDLDELDPESIAQQLMQTPAALYGTTPAPSALTPKQVRILTPYVAAGIRSAQYTAASQRAASHREFHGYVQGYLRAGGLSYSQLLERRGEHARARDMASLYRERGLYA